MDYIMIEQQVTPDKDDIHPWGKKGNLRQLSIHAEHWWRPSSGC